MRPLLVFLTFLQCAGATPLTGSGPNLPLPASGPVAPGLAPTIVTGSGVFSGTWAAPADTPWQGTFSATGTYPNSVGTGTSRWDFAGLNAGELPEGTFFRLGDVDDGSGTESITLRAYDSGNSLILTEWLENPVFLSGANSGDFVAGSMPGWSFSGGIYTFTGGTVAGNPTVTVSLINNRAISFLEVDKDTTNNGFGLAAPTPEPGTLGLIGIAGAVILAMRRRV